MQQRKNSNAFIDFFWGRYFVLCYSTILFGISVFCFFYSVWFIIPTTIFGLLSFIGWKDFSQKNMEFWLTIQFWADFDIYWKVSDLNSDNIFGKMTLTNFHTQETKERWFIREQRMKWLPDLLALLIKCTKKILVGLTTQCPCHIEDKNFRIKLNGKRHTTCRF